jgi:hypothetical protein
VAEHDDLELLELLRARTEERELQQAAQSEVKSEQIKNGSSESGGRGDRLYGRAAILSFGPS